MNAESEDAAKCWSGERVKEHASEGAWAMKKDFGPRKGSLSIYGGFPVWPNDLAPYGEMLLDVYNPQEKSYQLQCNFKDKYQYTHNHYYGMAAPPPWPDGRKLDPHAGHVLLEVKPGWNHLSFSFDEIFKRTGIEWHYIHHFWMWLPELEKSKEEATLYFDNLRLVRRLGEAGQLSPHWKKIELRQNDAEKLLYGFESYYEVWEWEWSGRKYLVEGPGVTEGQLGMQVNFGDLGDRKWEYGARFGVHLGAYEKDFARNVWSGWKTFRLDVFSPSDEPREVWMTFASTAADKKRTEVSRKVTLQKGANHIALPVEELVKEGLDLSNVGWFEFKPKRDSKGEFGWMVLDNLKLTKK